MSDDLAGKRRRLWLVDPHCRDCGRLTVLVVPITWRPDLKRFHPTGTLPDNAATLQHTVSRLNPDRGRAQHITLYCYRCNQEDGRQESSTLSIEEQWRRAGQLASPSLTEEQVIRLRNFKRLFLREDTAVPEHRTLSLGGDEWTTKP